MRLARASLLAAVLTATSVPLTAQERSPHPAPRAQAIPVEVALTPRLTPPPRPETVARPTRQVGPAPGLRVSPHPEPRRAARLRAARLQITRPPGNPSSIGPICGSRDILGRAVQDVPGALPGCGVRNPVQVVSVEGVRLSTAATMTCDAAQALRAWVDKGVKRAVGRTGGGVAELRVAAHYSCRTRNNRPGAKISEHGRGKAIDISGIVLQDGTVITVARGWTDRKQAKMLRKMHKAACGPFGTVLGPESDRYHKDHFHFDVASYRSGPYCR